MSHDHNHIVLSTWDRRRTLSNPFTHKNHTVSHLVDCVLKSNNGLNYSSSRLQYRAIQRWNEERLFKIWSSVKPELELLQKCFAVFDDLFFFGSLFQICVISLISDTSGDMGSCRDDGFVKVTGIECSIKVFRSKEESHEVQWAEILSSLLHGMCHAYLFLYACGKDGCKDDIGDEHGEVWQKFAKTVERAAWTQLGLELNLDCAQMI
jgi:hypothetical protein